MVDSLVDYIKKEREKGFDDVSIMKTLIKAEYSEEQIKDAFGISGVSSALQTQTNNKLPEKNKNTEQKQTEQGKPGKEEPKSPENIIITTEGNQSGRKKYFHIVMFILAIAFIILGFILIKMVNTPNNTEPITNPNGSIPKTEPVQIEKPQPQTNIKSQTIVKHEGAGCEYNTKIKRKMCLAVFGKNESICETINTLDNSEEKDLCINYAKLTKAVLKNDKSFCMGLRGLPVELCYGLVDENREICTTSSSEADKGVCNKIFDIFYGFKQGDKSVCQDARGFETDVNISGLNTDFCRIVIDNKDKIGIDAEPCRIYYDSWCP